MTNYYDKKCMESRIIPALRKKQQVLNDLNDLHVLKPDKNSKIISALVDLYKEVLEDILMHYYACENKASREMLAQLLYKAYDNTIITDRFSFLEEKLTQLKTNLTSKSSQAS